LALSHFYKVYLSIFRERPLAIRSSQQQHCRRAALFQAHYHQEAKQASRERQGAGPTDRQAALCKRHGGRRSGGGSPYAANQHEHAAFEGSG